jgi:ribosomal protein L44E
MKKVIAKAFFRVICTRCETTYDYQWEDVNTGVWSGQAESYEWTVCPVCERHTEHKFR